MNHRLTRNLTPSCILAAGDVVWLGDEVLPVVVELDASSGLERRRFTWDVGGRRALPPVSALIACPDTLWVSSPAAGGVVAIDRAGGTCHVVSLPRRVDALWRDGLGCLAREATEYAGDGRAPYPQVLWRLGGDSVEGLEFGAAVHDVVSISGRLVALVQRPADRPTNHRVREGWSEVRHPGALVVVEPSGATRTARELDDLDGELFVSDGSVWTTGFDRHSSSVRPLDTETGRLGPALDLEPASLDVAVADGSVWWTSHVRREMKSKWDRAKAVNRRSLAGGQVQTAVLEGDIEHLVAVDDTAWIVSRHEKGDGWDLVRCDVGSIEARRFSVVVDVSDLLPPPVPPEGVDPEAVAEAKRQKLRDVFLSGWVEVRTSARQPFIEGVTFESVERRCDFPLTEIVALFRHRARPGTLFGRSWRVFDDLGQPQPLEYVDIHLMEEIEANSFGLPPVDQCVPDDEGIVWF